MSTYKLHLVTTNYIKLCTHNITSQKAVMKDQNQKNTNNSVSKQIDNCTIMYHSWFIKTRSSDL